MCENVICQTRRRLGKFGPEYCLLIHQVTEFSKTREELEFLIETYGGKCDSMEGFIEAMKLNISMYEEYLKLYKTRGDLKQ